MKPGALKSIGDVLDAMRDQNWRNLMDDRKSKVMKIFIWDLGYLTQRLLRFKFSSYEHNYSNTERKIVLGINIRSKHSF